MSPVTTADGCPDRAAELFEEHRRQIFARTDHMFAGLMALQWLAGVAAAYWISPTTWAGSFSSTHPHVWAAFLLGGLISALPIVLALARPGQASTRYTIAIAQMLWSSLLIHLSGGRIETHFHVFGSLAFLAFYRDWRVLVPATIVVAGDHFLRGIYWPQSVFGVLAASPWRSVEHAAWVVFEDFFLSYACIQSVDEMRGMARQTARLEAVNEEIELTVLERTRQLRASQERFIQAFSSAPIGVGLLDPEGRWLQVNRALCGMVGHAAEELAATNFQAITHPDHRGRDEQALRDLLAGDLHLLQRETRYIHRAGQEVWVSLSVSVVRDPAGTPLYEIAQIQDITASKRAQTELEHAKEAAEAASSAKSEFLAMMSHELRTPLNIILGYTGLMRELALGPLTEEQSGALERVSKGALELLELITTTLDLSRLEAGRTPIARESVEPAALLHAIDAEIRELQQKPGVEVRWEMGTDLPSIHTDPAQLKIILKNLIGNAIKFTDAGQVIIAAEQRGAELVISVRDTGVGIAPEALALIFEPFRQGDGSSTRRHDGVGLGLYIVARLLELLGAHLSVESEPGRGSIFLVRMPAEGENRAAESDAGEATDAAAA